MEVLLSVGFREGLGRGDEVIGRDSGEGGELEVGRGGGGGLGSWGTADPGKVCLMRYVFIPSPPLPSFAFSNSLIYKFSF